MKVLMMTVLAAVSAAAAQEKPAWHRTLDEGKKASAASGRPVLLVTTWDKGT